ncbi:hypothetical protein BCR34DRAFT_554849 [Clohesyomyces aquaticus]|uniref:Cyclin-like domain-containing protein n=1 Tax=Clohesyomyces aquaticus TaxID=1231657 RepID=A0A1Y2A5K4_9PLEO|nr:hypothetical protein BCR34DRAFT_554849 [Clohesyomyces aquaticus]
MAPGPLATPRARPQRLERLESLNRPPPNKPAGPGKAASSKSPAPAPPRQAPPPPDCCDEPNVSNDGSSQICYNCGQVLGGNDIVAEVTFGENSAGAAVVQGGFIGENQRYANTMGGAVRGLEGLASRELAERIGKQEIFKLCAALNLQQAISEQAFSVYKLAFNHGFIQGRRVRNVAAVAIYLICRKRQSNTILLMDFAEKIQVNVWTLGDTYKQLLKQLMIEDPSIHATQAIQEVEPLMLKFCEKLEFGSDSHQVAQDAAAILKRMNRDWMVQGRSPAGLCGACIILAARMNNFRRTVREVVYVVRVCDATISQRLLEFKRTQSSKLTVDQFRDIGQKLKVKTLPPAIYKRQEKEQKKALLKRRRSEMNDDEQEEDSAEQSGAGPSTQQPAIATRTSKRRKHANGNAPQVATPNNTRPTEDGDDSGMIDLAAAEALANPEDADHVEVLVEMAEGDDYVVPPKRRGRPPKKREPIIIPEEDLEIEAEIEEEILQRLEEWEEIFKEFEDNENHPLLLKSLSTAKLLADKHQPDAGISTSEDLDDDEFDEDPDVKDCLLSEEESRVKERMWVTENLEWLRTQQKKNLEKALEEASGKPKKKQIRKSTRMGDGSLLAGRPAATPADAVKTMLEKRGVKNTFSEFINYDRLNEVYPAQRKRGSGEKSVSQSKEGSQVQTPEKTGENSEWTQVETPDDWNEEEEEDEEVDAEGEIVEEELEYEEEQGGYYDEEEGFGGEDGDDDY